MAIGQYSAVPPPPESPAPSHEQAGASATAAPQHAPSVSGTIDIEAWTVSALESLSVSPDARGTGGTPLVIPLYDHHARPSAAAKGVPIGVSDARAVRAGRDSLRTREALLKGKEGSRRRRRWEMARLSDVSTVEPPLASDFEPRPVYPIHHIPYHVAQYWDRGLRQQVEEKKGATSRNKHNTSGVEGRGRVPRDLREKVKRTPGVKGWMRMLEEPVRQFLVEQGEAREPEPEPELDASESDFSDDEIVFVGRKGAAARYEWKKAHREVRDRLVDRGMIFDSPEDEEGSAFKRWLTHSISDYYGLESRSVTMGSPARRCVYIGIKEVDVRKGSLICAELPRPLWELF